MTRINLESFKDIKTSNWAFLLYPESAPKSWFDFLTNTGAQFCVSPLHNLDIVTSEWYDQNVEYCHDHNIEVGDLKKPHYHIIISCSGSTTFNHITNMVTKPLNQPHAFPLLSVPGYYHYLWHDYEDHVIKPEYDKTKIIRGNGFDISDFVDVTQSQNVNQIQQIIEFCIVNNIYEYSVLTDIFFNLHMFEASECLRRNQSYFRMYLDSKRHAKMDQQMDYVYKLQDFQTGEIRTITLNYEQIRLDMGYGADL